MAKTRVDEVLGRVGRDTEAIPRYDLVDQNGNTIATNVKLVLKNKIITAGMPVNKAAMDECLAASGTTAGSATAFTLKQDNFALFDGALVRIKLHVDSGATPTLNVNGTGAKKLMQSKTKPLRAGIPAGTGLPGVRRDVSARRLRADSGAGQRRGGGEHPADLRDAGGER